jgi:hypothetical protein
MRLPTTLVLGVLLVFAGCSSSPPSRAALDGGGKTDSGITQDSGIDAGSDAGTVYPAPQVIGTSPADGAVDVDSLAPVTATFDLALDPASVNASTFKVSGVSGQVGYDATLRTATFTPDEPYPGQSELTVHLATGIRSTDGAPLASEVTFSFTTGGVLAPAILAHSPEDGARVVSPAALPSVTFN